MRSGVGRGGAPADGSIEDMKRHINRLNYCYFLLSHPAASLPGRPHRQNGAGRPPRIAL